MDLDIDLSGLPGRPRSKAAHVTVIRELRESDLALLAGPRLPAAVPSIQKVSERHHSLARLIAHGMKNVDAARVSGMSLVRVGMLMQDPAFLELVAHYREQAAEVHVDVQRHMCGLTLDMLQELQDRYDDDPTQFTNAMLLDIATKMLDRTGHGPTSTREITGKNGGPVEIDITKQELARRLTFLLNENAEIIEDISTDG